MFRFDMKENMKIKNGGLLIITIILIFIVFLIFELVLSYFSTFVELGNQKSDWGTFGDFVGGTLNPLLSFFGFIALLWTVHIQRKQINDDKKDRKKQQFENTFFALLNVHNQILESFDKKEIDKDWIAIISGSSLSSAKSTLAFNAHLYEHYFRFLYRLLKFIAIHSPDSQISSNFNAENIKNNQVSLNEKMYSDVVRALLTNEIVKLLAVNCYYENGEKSDYSWGYKCLIERYALLEHIPFDFCYGNYDDVFSSGIRNFYDKRAFGL